MLTGTAGSVLTRRAGSVLALGLVAMLGWSLAVSASMPSWYDPDRDCQQAFPLAEGNGLRITSSWLPPHATCDFGDGELHQFISPTRSTVLTIVFALTAALTLAGLYFVLRRLTAPAGILRSAEAVDLRGRQLRHLGAGAFLTLLVVGLFAGANVFAAFLGGPPGMLIVALTAIAALSAVAAALDRQLGPLPSTARDSQRRGAVVGCVTIATVFFITAASGNFPFYRIWVAPVGAITYLLVVTVQWSRATRGVRTGLAGVLGADE
ncbi:hypothetical protein GCM10022235_16870 [Kribbella ginsengisoli]|uniref:DUF998 domain-containing protein n=1 Tax=Kribbella ginsengisoli TaxID=363865 RepID=A0ABP6WG19_9ACTN